MREPTVALLIIAAALLIGLAAVIAAAYTMW